MVREDRHQFVATLLVRRCDRRVRRAERVNKTTVAMATAAWFYRWRPFRGYMSEGEREMSKRDSPDHDAVEIIEQFGADVNEPSLPDKGARLEVDAEVMAVLEENEGSFLTAEIVAAITNYSEGHVRNRLHALTEDDDTDVERERWYKEILAAIIGGDFVVLSDDKDVLLDVVKQYCPSELGKAQSMTTSELRDFLLEEYASGQVTTKTDALYFGIRE